MISAAGLQVRLQPLSKGTEPVPCPRCDSTNTKSRYFDSDILSSMPRHFCKTCRRYWGRRDPLVVRSRRKSKRTDDKNSGGGDDDNNGGGGDGDNNGGGGGENKKKDGSDGKANGNNDNGEGSGSGNSGNMKRNQTNFKREPMFGCKFGYHAGDENECPVGQLQCVK